MSLVVALGWFWKESIVVMMRCSPAEAGLSNPQGYPAGLPCIYMSVLTLAAHNSAGIAPIGKRRPALKSARKMELIRIAHYMVRWG